MSEQISIKQRIYDAIAENGSISRIRLAEKYNLRLATVTEVTRSLLEDQLVMEAGEEESTGGRKPVLLKINPFAFFTIGLRLSPEHLSGGVFNSALEQKYEVVEPTLPDMNGPQFLELLDRTVQRLLAESGIPAIQLKGIGVGLPNRVNLDTGIYDGVSYYPQLPPTPLKDHLEDCFQVPVVVDHDVVLMTMAEYYLSGASVPDNLGVLFIGQGIGSRFVINGEIYRGVTNRAGEFGHLSLQTDGPACYCGNRGCFERLASLDAIERNYGGGKTFEEIVDRAMNHDDRAVAVLNQAAGYIALGCANIINLLDVEMLVINGDIVLARQLLEPVIQEQLARQVIGSRANEQRRVVFSLIGKKVGTLGPALMAADANFQLMDINIFPKRREHSQA